MPGATHIRVQWKWRPLVDCHFRRWLDTLAPLAAEVGGAENVRVLIGFDS